MSNSLLLFLTLGIALLVAITIQVYLYIKRKKQKESYPLLWEKFIFYKEKKLYKELEVTGNKLIYNKHLTQEHLTIIHNTAIDLATKYSEFESFRLNAYNKQLHYNREIF